MAVATAKTDNAAKRNLLPRIRIERRYEPVEFILRWPPVPLVALSDKAESCECNASEIYALGRNNDSVNGRGVA